MKLIRKIKLCTLNRAALKQRRIFCQQRWGIIKSKNHGLIGLHLKRIMLTNAIVLSHKCAHLLRVFPKSSEIEIPWAADHFLKQSVTQQY